MGRYTVVLSDEAFAFFESTKVDSRIKNMVRRKLGSLAESPHAGKPLGGEFRGCRRLAVSCYRIIYHIQETRLVVDVIDIGLRRDIYSA